MRRRRKWVDFGAYVALRLVETGLAIFPIDSVLRAMRRLGWVWYHLPQALPELVIPRRIGRLWGLRWSPKLATRLNVLLLKFREHRGRAERHVRLAFPEMDERQASAVVLTSMQQLAMLVVELLLSPRLVTQWSWARHLRLRKLDEAIRVLLDDTGCIMLTGHYGNWEVLGFGLATLGFDLTAVMRPLDNEYLNRHLLDRREQSGLRLLYKKGATQSAGDVLAGGGVLCFIADQNAGRKGVFVDFFGRKASTYRSIALLAISHDVPIIVGCARRVGLGFEYEICVGRVIRPEEWQGREDEVTWITQTYTRAIEDLVRVAPGQYLWIHRRWKTRPPEERAAASTPGV